MLGLAAPGQALALSGSKELLQPCLALKIFLQRGGQQRAGWVSPPAHRPVRAQPQHQLVVKRAHGRVRGLVDLYPLISATKECLVGEEADTTPNQLVSVAMVVNYLGVYAHISGLSFKHQ